MKQQLSEALAKTFVVNFSDDLPNQRDADADLVEAAARLVERLLPGVCDWCHGDGQLVRGNFNKGGEFYPCPHCQNGRVWDEGIVEAVATAISLQLTGDRDSQFAAPAIARAVLSALVELLTEKAER